VSEARRSRTVTLDGHRGAVKETDDWRTPPWLLDLLVDGRAFFDPCPANPDGLRGNDGLLSEWPSDRLVFVNPPYSDPGPWVAKAAAHLGPIVLLLPNDPTTEWWQAYATLFRVTPLGQRIRFLSGSLGYGRLSSARFPSAVWRKP
jgi:hypothetical protein